MYDWFMIDVRLNRGKWYLSTLSDDDMVRGAMMFLHHDRQGVFDAHWDPKHTVSMCISGNLYRWAEIFAKELKMTQEEVIGRCIAYWMNHESWPKE